MTARHVFALFNLQQNQKRALKNESPFIEKLGFN